MSDLISADIVAEPLRRLLQALKDLRGLTGRRFTLDGVALGDLGEAMAAAQYGVRLLPTQSQKGYDGLAPNDERHVEVKITQGKAVAIAAHGRIPDHLLVFHLDPKTGEIRTVYNGPAKPAWKLAGTDNGRGQRRLSLAALRGITVPRDQQLPEVEEPGR